MTKVPISQKIILNKIEIWKIWNHTDTGQFKCKVELCPSKFALKETTSACEYRKTMAEKPFEHEFNNIPQSLCKDNKNGIKLYHASKAKITERFNSSTSVMLPHHQKGTPAIVVEMSSLIRAKAFATHIGSLTNLGEFAVLVYYEVMKLASNYDGIELVFDRYF